MSITVEAVYENGVLKPTHALPLKEAETVRVTVHTESSPLLAAYGIVQYRGDAETRRRVAEDPEFSHLEAP